MNNEQTKLINYFREEYDELERLCNSDKVTDHGLNKISSIIRRMFFDEKSYLNDIVRILKTDPPVFTCAPYISFGHPSLVFGSANDGFFPPHNPSNANIVLASARLLGKQIIMEYKGEVFNVKQLIKYIANKEGGVHFDQKKLGISDTSLREIQDYFQTGGRAGVTSSLRAIGLVTLEGLKYIRLSV